MKTYLCEKPSQAKDIAGVLGVIARHDGYYETRDGAVTWCFGHLLEQANPDDYRPELKKWDLSTLPIIPDHWQVKPRKDAAKQIKVIQALLSKAKKVVIATDADREGEMIGREMLEYVGYSGPVDRLWLSALDPVSIERGLAKLRPGPETAPLYQAALARSRADWLVGMNLTRAATLALGDGSGVLSIGRVQTPTLALVVRRDEAIENFRPRDYYEITASVLTEAGSLTLRHAPAASPEDLRIYDKETAEKLARQAAGAEGPLQVITERKRQGPPKLFSLSGLQKVANRKWGWSADKTLKTAQSLYETHKATTYPRSDCPYLPNEQEADIQTILAHLSGHDDLKTACQIEQPIIRKSVFASDKVTAHHAIIPTTSAADLSAMSADEKKAFILIATHYIAALLPDHEYDATSIEMDADGVHLRATGRVTVSAGWKLLFEKDDTDEDADEETAALPPVKDGDKGRVKTADVATKQTKPPAPYTEGSLISDMAAVAKYVDTPALKARLKETAGIGTEATRASIIETLKNRSYLHAKGKAIVSTAAGRALVHAVPPKLADPGETAIWEESLEAIAGGGNSDGFLDNIANEVKQLITDLQSSAASTQISQSEHACPECGKGMRRRKGANGWFWGCSGYPECRYTLPDNKGKPGLKTDSKPASRTGGRGTSRVRTKSRSAARARG